MAEKHLNPAPVTPEGAAAGTIIPIRRPLPLVRPAKPPSVSLCDTPLYVRGSVKIANLLHGLESGGLCLRFDRPSGRFVIDDKPHATQGE
jgi:hypothetical protein